MRKRSVIIPIAVVAVVGAIASQFLAIMVQPPIGALPDGAMIVVHRGGEMQFIESADAMCERKMGGVSLMCRMAALSAVMKDREPLVRLPYIHQLYLISTGGKEYDR